MSKRKNFEAPESSSIANFNRMIGAEDNTPVYPGQDVISIDENLTKLIDEQRWATVRDQMGVHSKGLMGVEETKQGIDIYQEVDTDKDGNIHTYDVMVTPDGKTKRLGLADTMQNVNIVDVLNKKEVNPAYTQYIKEKLFGKMFTDTDPETGKMYSDTSKGFFENAIMNMATSQLSILGAKIFGESSIGKHGVWDPVLNKLDFNENGKVTYDGIDLSLSSKELSPVMDWFQRKTTFKSSGFMESFANTGLTFLGDMPLFYLSGSGAGAILGKALPSIMNASSIPAKFAQHLMQNYLMLNMVETPRMITHGLYEGSDALLEDIKHTAEFAVMAGGFSTIGDLAGLGVSHLMQRAKPLTTSNISSFLKQNPRIQENLIGGFASGLLGYTTAEGSTQDKLATGLVFASMHFSSPKGWKNYIKGEGKTVMLDKVNFESLQKLRRSGVSLEEAYRELGITEPKYYEREKSNLYEIDGDAFTNKGEVNRLGSEPIVLDRKNIGNFNYIAEAEPFAKVTLRQAFQDTKIANLHEKVLAEGFKNIENPFDKTSEKDKWENFEFNKSLTAGKLAVILYGENLYKQIRQNGLPKDMNLDNLITKSAEGLDMPRRVYEKMLTDMLPEYIKDPTQFKATTKDEGGSLKFLPEDYRKSFESALSGTELALKKYANARMIEELNNRYERAQELGLGGLKKFGDEILVSEADYGKALDMLGQAKQMSDVNKAIEKAGYSDKIFDDLRKKIKAEETTKGDIKELIDKTAEDKLNKDLDTEAGLAMIEKEFGSRKLADTLSPEEISTIGKTGAIEPKTREALQQLSEEAWRSGMPEELRPTKEKPIVEIPKEIVEEKKLGYEVNEPQKAYVTKEDGTKELVDVTDIRNNGKNITYKDSEGKMFNTFDYKIELIQEPKVDHQTYVTEIKEILKSNLAYREKQKIDTAFNEVDKVTGQFKAKEFYDKLAEKLWGTKDSEVYTRQVEDSGWEKVPEGEKRSISEAVTAIRETIKEVFGEEQLKNWDAFDHIWKIAEKMPEVGFYTFYGKGDPNAKVRERSSTGAHYESGNDAIGLNMEHSQKSFYDLRESLSHEVVHALLYGNYKDAQGKVHRYSESLEPELKKIWDKAAGIWANDRVGKIGDTLKHWGDYVFDKGAERTVNPVQEMVTVGLTSPDFARWLNGIAVDGVRKEVKGSALQAMRDKVMEWFGLTRIHNKTAMDEIVEVLNNKFAEWGVFDQNTGQLKDNVRVGLNDRFPSETASKTDLSNRANSELKTSIKLPPNENLDGSVERKREGDTNILPQKEKTVKSELERNFDRNVEGWKPKHFIDTDKLAIEAIFKGASKDKNFSPSIIINQESEGSRPLTREALLNIIASNAKHTLGNISHHNPAYTSKKMSEMLSFIKLLPEIDASYRGTVERISGRFEEEVNRNLLLGNKYEELNALKNQKMREYKELFGRDYLEEKSLALKEDRLEEFKAQNPELESLTSEINGLRNEFNGRMEVGNRTALIEKTIRELQNNAGEEIVRSPKFEEVSRKPITLDVEAEKPLPKSEPEAKTRKVEKEEVIKSRAEIIRDRELQEKESLRTGAIQNKDRREPIVSFGEKAQDFMIRHTSINDISNKVRDYLYQSIVPVFRKETSPRFREDAYKYGEELMRQAPYQFNTIMKRHDGWAGGQAWRKFGDVNPVNGEVRSQNGKDFLNAFKDYEYGRYQGKITKDLTWDEFKTWANMNPEQQKMLDIYRASVKAGIDKMKEMKVKYMVELDPNLANYITKSPKSLKEYGMEGLAKEEIEQRVAGNLELKRKIAQKAIDDHYANWDKHVYYNSIRPVNKNSILVEVTRDSMNRKDKEGNFISDREYSYFDSMKEAQDYLNSKVAEGWTKQEMLRVKDILTKQDHWGKLNVSQLMQLANDGHIPLTNDIIQKLMDITKKGVDLHDISKEYIPGMKYTGQEFELQFERFLREAIYGSHKSYSLTKINDNLNKWRADIDSIIGGISKTSTKGIDAQTIQKLEEEYKYAYGYYNQLRAPEKSIIDPIRGFTFSYYIGGLKPGFLFQQSLQTLQTSLHQGYRELSAGKLGTFGDATRLLGEASAEAIKAGIALRALKEGKDISRIGADAEYVKVLQDLELMGKMRNVGIAEMTGMSGESDYFYSHNFNKVSEGFIRISNALGGGIEKFTRVQTAGLFYKIGKQKGLSGEGLLNFVADGIDKSMAEFGKGGRAPVFDSKGSIPNQGTITNAMKKSFLTLKTFSFYNTSMYYDIIKSKQWGALGTKMMAGTGMHGITKFPLIASLFMLAELFTDEDMDYTTLRAAYELDDKLPVPLGKFLRGGFGGFAGIDTRDMLSETTPLVTDLVANSWAPTWEGKLLEVTLGAPLGFTKDAVEAADGIKDELKYRILGDTMYTKTERDRQVNNFNKAAPLWIRNIIKSMDYNEDGVTLRGNEIIAREDLSGWDIFLKAMSFPVDRINTAYIEGKDGFDAQIGHHKSVISSAKKYMLEVRDNSKLSGESKREEIKKAENSIKESKAEIINLEKQKRERDRK